MAPNFVFNETVAVELQASHAITVASHLKAAASSKSFGEAAFSISSPLVSDGTSAFYQLDADTGVWALTALKPESTTNAAITSMMATAAGGLKALIIDTTGNDGGLICAGVAMLQMLFPSATPLPFDVRLSKAMAAFVQYADSTPALRQQGTVFSTSDLVSQNSRSSNILSAVRAIARGGKTSSYSDRFDLSCAVFANPFAPASLPKLSKGWSPDAISLVSDGRCGSMCAEMTRSSGAAFQPSSFEGGSVASFEKIAADAAAIVASANTAAAAFAGVAVPCGAAAVRDGELACLGIPAEALLPVEDITDRAAVWKAAAAAMGKGHSSQPSSTLHAAYTSGFASAA
ncbi:hypothetical protein DFJ73DRAFT_775887 [Zopfochytrium polystomum]|nr:hypothetical protein DFJ73DRAFT_775887 [Zopfochytrium polystomum]